MLKSQEKIIWDFLTIPRLHAVLTKKGRELLARGENEFKITKFALSDDEVDYTLWDTTHPNGTNYYGAVIENMPMLEAISDENQSMRYKQVTLPKDTVRMPILELAAASYVFQRAGVTQAVSPTTRNGDDATDGYTFILHDSDAATMVVGEGAEINVAGATTPIFLSEEEKKRSITVVAQRVNITSRSLTSVIKTQLTVIGNKTGATFTVPLTVKATLT